MRTTTCSAFVLFITLLAAAPVSILAITPERWQLDSSRTRASDVVTRPVARPSVPAAGDTTRTSELETPFDFGRREMAIDATASFTEPRSLHLADVTVLSLHDRTVKLRFTMAGVPLPPFSTTCAVGRALVSVRVNRLTMPRP